MRKVLVLAAAVGLLWACNSSENKSFMSTNSAAETSLWLEYSKQASTFKLWSPNAELVRIHLYNYGTDGAAYQTVELSKNEFNSVWTTTLEGDFAGKYYTFQIQEKGSWLPETPGPYATAVGVNGNRAMVLDLESTNPTDWQNDQYVQLEKYNDAVLYELHIRDYSIHKSTSAQQKGKYLGLVEPNTTNSSGESTGIAHIKELGATHVHLLPTFDHYSIDESRLDEPQFNWGYDPQNYNAPEGSFSNDPFNAAVRINEFKQMVQAFHNEGIGVVLDVVYNHTGRTNESNFNLSAPGYFYRQWPDGKFSDASACGNETASDKEMMRKYMIESVVYWAKEYHLDGFRFDLMAIHDIETMNQIAEAVKKVNPNCIIYGEGWTAGDSPLPVEQRALKAHAQQMPKIAVFSDDLRDAAKGSVFDEHSTGFVSNAQNTEESIKFGIVGSIQHPQIDYSAVNYSNQPYTNQPWQAVSYVSCHDNHTLYDKLIVSQPNATEAEIKAMHKLALGLVLTSQGTPFLHAGTEFMRTKFGEHNSYNLPDSINQIDWSYKTLHADVVQFVKNMIELRKNHPAFRMATAEQVQQNLEFLEAQNNLIVYQLNGAAVGDSWGSIVVALNGSNQVKNYNLPKAMNAAVLSNNFVSGGPQNTFSKLSLEPHSIAVFYAE